MAAKDRRATLSLLCTSWPTLCVHASCSHMESCVTISTIQIALGTSFLYYQIATQPAFRWVRVGDKWHDGCAVVICNGDDG